MKIVHLMLFNFYADDAFYQENVLPRQNKIDGHDVSIIASTEVFIKGNTMGFVKPSTYFTKEGIKVTRVPYKIIINKKISRKIRAYKGVYELINEFSPDIIFSHGIGGYDSKTIATYMKANPNTKLFIDCHSDYTNSATNFLSKYLLHRIFYRYYFWKYVKYAEKVYYIAAESISFLDELYGFRDKEKLQYFPLGGYVVDKNVKQSISRKIRKQLNITKDEIVLIHSGKMDYKKKSFELLSAFTQLEAKNVRLLIIGVFSDDVYLSVKHFIESDNRIIYIGWKEGKELQDYLSAGDIYLQPGWRTVTVQNAVCCGCSIIVNKSLCYTHLFGDAALYAETTTEIKELLEKILLNPKSLDQQKNSLMMIAKDKLDYRVLANTYVSYTEKSLYKRIVISAYP